MLKADCKKVVKIEIPTRSLGKGEHFIPFRRASLFLRVSQFAEESLGEKLERRRACTSLCVRRALL